LTVSALGNTVSALGNTVSVLGKNKYIKVLKYLENKRYKEQSYKK